MIQSVTVRNFRSIEACDVELAPLTVIYGPTSAGKSSLMYSLLVLRNFLLNPNQALDGFFNLGFQNLGGFDACVFNHDANRAVVIGAQALTPTYGLSLSKGFAQLGFNGMKPPASLRVPIPYPINQTFSSKIEDRGVEYAVNWNGIGFTVAPVQPVAETQARAFELAVQLNGTVEAIKRVDVVPHKRGFFKPSYSPVPVSPTPTSEDEVASVIISDMNLPARVSVDTEEIFGRDFRTQTPPGTATVYFQTTEKQSRTPGYLVNDGFGVNQVIYMLAKIHRVDVQTVLIEEPEVHLHPTIVRKFARNVAHIVRDEGKQLVFTTHSEQFVVSVLSCVAEKVLQPEQVRCYYATRDRKPTTFQQQRVLANGQLEGGLGSFIEGELEDLKRFLAVAK